MGEENKPEEEILTSEQWTEKGIEQFNLKNYYAARSYFDKAISLDPDNVIALLHKAIALEKLQYYQLAITIFEGLIERKVPSDIVNQAKEYLNQTRENRKQWKIRRTKKHIKDLSEGSIFGCVGCFALVAGIFNVVFFVMALNDGFTSWGFIISAVIFVFFCCAWFSVNNKFESTSKIMMEMYEELKKKPDEESKED